MPPDMKHILANMNVKLYSWTFNFSQGSVAPDLKYVVVSISVFPQIRSEFTSEKTMKISPLLPKLSWK